MATTLLSTNLTITRDGGIWYIHHVIIIRSPNWANLILKPLLSILFTRRLTKIDGDGK